MSGGLSSQAEEQRVLEKIRSQQPGYARTKPDGKPGILKGIQLSNSTNVQIPEETDRLEKHRQEAASPHR